MKNGILKNGILVELIPRRYNGWGRGIYRDRPCVGVVISYDGYGKFMVLWSNKDEPTSHDLYELVPYKSR